ncbi:hypothetical protein Tco_0931059 [Tanacetum coccineum]
MWMTFSSRIILACYLDSQSIPKTISKLPSLIGMRSISKDVGLEGTVASSGWPFVSTVPGQETPTLVQLTLDRARSFSLSGGFFCHCQHLPSVELVLLQSFKTLSSSSFLMAPDVMAGVQC